MVLRSMAQARRTGFSAALKAAFSVGNLSIHRCVQQCRESQHSPLCATSCQRHDGYVEVGKSHYYYCCYLVLHLLYVYIGMHEYRNKEFVLRNDQLHDFLVYVHIDLLQCL